MTMMRYQFGPFAFDKGRRVLLKHGVAVTVGHKALVLLETLLEAEGRVVSKSDLIDAAWATDNIEESNLAVQIAALRKSLGQTKHGEEWIQTVQRIGYRFVDPDNTHDMPIQIGAADAVVAHSDKPSVAVLPFLNLSSDPEQDYFSDGVTSDIITELSRWRLLAVQSRGATFRYRASTIDIKQIAQELKVRYVVEGSVRRIGERLRITVQLIDAETGNQVWAEKFDRELAEIFAVQDQVVKTIVSTLVGRVMVAALERVNRKPPTSLVAYECVLKGNALPWGDPIGRAEATKLFAKAIEIDPNYGFAHALLAILHVTKWSDDLNSTDSVLQEAFDLAKRAIELDSNESTCFSIFALVCLSRRSFEAALQHMQRAIELNPNNQWNAADMGIVQTYLGEADAALSCFKRAKEIDPFFDPPWYFMKLGQAYLTLRRYDEALAAFELSPLQNFREAAFMAACHARLSNPARAAFCVALCLKMMPAFSIKRFMSKEPYKKPTDGAHLAESLRLASLPE
jgi:TolB-like protein